MWICRTVSRALKPYSCSVVCIYCIAHLKNTNTKSRQIQIQILDQIGSRYLCFENYYMHIAATSIKTDLSKKSVQKSELSWAEQSAAETQIWVGGGVKNPGFPQKIAVNQNCGLSSRHERCEGYWLNKFLNLIPKSTGWFKKWIATKGNDNYRGIPRDTERYRVGT